MIVGARAPARAPARVARDHRTARPRQHDPPPGRTAVTAAALMIGLALVSFVSILAAGTKASINKAIDASFAGNLIVENSSAAGNQGIPADIPAALHTIPGVRQVTAMAFTEGRVREVEG